MQSMKQRIQILPQNANTTITSLAFLSGWKEVIPVLYVIRFAFCNKNTCIYQTNISSSHYGKECICLDSAFGIHLSSMLGQWTGSCFTKNIRCAKL